MKPAGIKDVAKEAGVSTTTVSRALNGYSDVSEKTRNKILEVVEKLNYAPNINARTLGGKKDITIALLMSGLKKKDESGIAFGVLSGIYHTTVEKNGEFMLLTTNASKQKEMNYFQLCKQKNIDGVVIQGIRSDDPYYEVLINSQIPCVIIDFDLTGEKVCSISIDNTEASYTAVKFLLENGHKNIALLNGHEAADVSKERLSGYAKAIIESGETLDFQLMKHCDFDEEIAYKTVKQLIKENKEFTAIFCASDVMAVGAIRAINDSGLKVPEDISVVGFDDMPIAKYVNGGLSTIRQDPFKTGKVAAEILYDMINGVEVEKHIYLEYVFMNRKTVKKL